MVEEFIKYQLLDEADLKHIYGLDDLHLAKVKLREKDRRKLQNLRRVLRPEDLMSRDLLEAKLSKSIDEGLSIIIQVYRKIGEPSQLSWQRRWVVTRAGKLVLANEAYFGEVPKEVEELADRFPEVRKFVDELNYVHDRFVKELGKDFLAKLGVKEISFQEVCRKVLLPKIMTRTRPEPPGRDEIISISMILRKAGVHPDEEVWVVTRKGIERSSKAYYPLDHFKPFELYEDQRIGIAFLDLDAYAREGAAKDWQQFFEKVVRGMKACQCQYSYCYVHPDYKDVINKVVNVLTSSQDKDDLIKYTRALKKLHDACKTCWDYEKIKYVVNVLTTDNTVLRSTDVFLSSKYRPKEDWMKWIGIYKIGDFISEDYPDDGDIDG